MQKSNDTNVSAVIDWLEFTVTTFSLEDVIVQILNLRLEEFSRTEKGRFGYTNQLKWSEGNLFVMFNDQEDSSDRMGVHVMISGQGCRQYESHHTFHNLLFYLTILDEKVKFSRVDIAIDDFSDRLINFTRIHQAAIQGHFTSRWNKWDEVNSRQCATGEFLGRTMYFGSQSSSIFCRIYDKSLERKAKSDGDEEIPETWTRLEMVYKKERAQKLVYHLIDRNLAVGDAIRGTLRQYLRFIQPPKIKDDNKARWPDAPWWAELLAGIDRLQLTSRQETKSIDEMESWVDKQIAPTIAAILTAKDGEIDWLHQLISKGASRLSQRHKDAIEQYQRRIING